MAGPIGLLAAQGAQTIMGLAAGELNDRRQLRQQGKLNEQQFEIDGRALARQKAADLGMIEATSYGFQKEKMKEAGLSPGLMYGGGGPGSAMTGGTASTNAAKAPGGGGEIMGMQLMQAQKELLQAQTEKTKAETTKTAGVDTDLTKWQALMVETAQNIASGSANDVMEKIQGEAWIIKQQMKAAEGMVTAELQKKQAEVVGQLIMNQLNNAKTDLTIEQMTAIGVEIAQKWESLRIQEGYLEIEKFVRDVSDSTKLTVETITKAVQLVGGGLIKGIPNKTIRTHELGRSAEHE